MLPQWLFGVTFTYPAYFCMFWYVAEHPSEFQGAIEWLVLKSPCHVSAAFMARYCWINGISVRKNCSSDPVHASSMRMCSGMETAEQWPCSWRRLSQWQKLNPWCQQKHTPTHSEILEIAEQFEDSIERALQSDESNEDMYEEISTAGTQDGEPSESDHEAQETVVYQYRRQRRGRGNRYQDIKTSLHVYDEFDDCFRTCASLRRVSDPTLTLVVSLLT